MTQLPAITLNNAMQLPAIGLGVFQSSPDETVAAVQAAIEVGYRHIDTAAAYGNEREVGQALRLSGIPREDVVLETKVWISDYGFDATQRAFDVSRSKLGVDTIDLLLLHQPMPDRFDLTLAAYRALEVLLDAGKVRAIGVSNFQVEDLERLHRHTDVVPAVNQIELHPYFQEPEVVAANARAGILTQAWSPIGGITFYPGWGEQGRSTLHDPVLQDIAAAHGKSPAQVMLRWHLQHGRSAIPKSVTPSRIAQNIQLLDFQLSPAEVAAVDALDTGVRSGPEPSAMTLATNPITIPDA